MSVTKLTRKEREVIKTLFENEGFDDLSITTKNCKEWVMSVVQTMGESCPDNYQALEAYAEDFKIIALAMKYCIYYNH